MHTVIKAMLTVLGCTVVLCCAVPTVMACSSVFITSSQPDPPAVIGRTMDFEENEGKAMGVGLAEDVNVSNVNMQDNVTQRAEWTNKYDYIGKLLNASPCFVEGINTAGLYVGTFYMPGITRFSEYDPNGKPALSYINLVPYLLGTSGTVEEALENVGKFQVVMGAAPMPGSGYEAPVLHYSIRDKSGKSAVIEWLEGGPRIYLDKLLTYNINIQELEAATHGTVNQDYENAGKVVTNNPTYDWQNACFQKQDKHFQWTGDRTDREWDGSHQNASGTYGLRGDWTAPSRFQRPMALLKPGIMPVPSTTAQAKYLAYGAILSLIQPAGVSVCPTIWISISDLKNGEYQYRLLCLLGESGDPYVTKIVIPDNPGNFGLEKFYVKEVKTYISEGRENVQHIVNTFTGLVPADQRDQIINTFQAPTPGATPLFTTF